MEKNTDETLFQYWKLGVYCAMVFIGFVLLNYVFGYKAVLGFGLIYLADKLY